MKNTNIIMLTESEIASRFPVKADTLPELENALAELNRFYHENGDAETMQVKSAVNRVQKAVAYYNDVIKAARISELLALGTGAAMWREFLAHRTVYKYTLTAPSAKGAYRLNKHDGSDANRAEYLTFADLNTAYVAMETKRMEQAGEVVPTDLTLASKPTFTLDFQSLLVAARRRFIDTNFGKAATGSSTSYNTVDKNGVVRNVGKPAAPSVNECVHLFDTAVAALLPENFFADGSTFHAYKADIRELGVAMNRTGKTVHGMASVKFMEHWFLNLIQKRIDSGKILVYMPSEQEMEEVTAPVEEAPALTSAE